MNPAPTPEGEKMREEQEIAEQTLLPNTRSEEAGGSPDNTSEEVAQRLRKMATQPRSTTIPREKWDTGQH